MNIVQSFDRGLDLSEAAQGFSHAQGIRVRRGTNGIGCSTKLRGAAALHPVDVDIERTNVAAQMFLVRDAGFKTGEIEADHVGASSNQGSRQGTEQADAAVEEFQKLCVFRSHGFRPNSGQFVQLMFLVLIRIRVQERVHKDTACGLRVHRATRSIVFRLIPVARRQQINFCGPRCTEIFHEMLDSR
jgi:hypothetical protein